MELNKYIHILMTMPLFKNFSQDCLIHFLATADYRIHQYNKDNIIFLENETCNTFNIILDGTVQIQKIDSFGKVLTIAEFKPGDTIGENLIFGKTNIFPMTILAKNKVIILHIHKASIIHLCQTDSVFLNEFLALISDKTITLSTKLKQIALKTIRQKICEFLLSQYTQQKQLKIRLNVSKKEWADRIGVQRPSLSRELIKMKKEGLIDYDRNTIFIKSIEKLQEYI